MHDWQRYALLWILFGLAAISLYQPSLHIGLLSDDFVLVDWARSGNVLPASWPFVRPMQLLLWSMFLDGVPSRNDFVLLHVLNVVFHSTNAVLVTALARQQALPWHVSVLAGAIFLVYPTSVEPVVWPSAFADVLLATLLLSAFLTAGARRFSVGSIVLVTALSAAALLTKETAIAATALFAIMAAIRRDARRSYIAAAFVSLATTVVYLVARSASGRMSGHPGISIDDIVVALHRPLTTLALPFHAFVFDAFGVIVLTWFAAWSIPLILVSIREPVRQALTSVLVLVCWVYASIGPTLGVFALKPDLQGSRYLYLATTGWAVFGAVALLRAGAHDSYRYARAAATAVVIATCVFATRVHQHPWAAASRLQNEVVGIIASIPQQCERVFVAAVPDNVQGAYVGRNGLTEAVLMMTGREVAFAQSATEVLPECRVDFTDLAGP